MLSLVRIQNINLPVVSSRFLLLILSHLLKGYDCSSSSISELARKSFMSLSTSIYKFMGQIIVILFGFGFASFLFLFHFPQFCCFLFRFLYSSFLLFYFFFFLMYPCQRLTNCCLYSSLSSPYMIGLDYRQNP